MTSDDAGVDETLRIARQSLEESLGEQSSQVRLAMTGRVPLWRAQHEVFTQNHQKFQTIGYGMVFVLAAIIFRGFWAVIILGCAPALAIFWTFGLLKFFD